ncbi:calvin cycle protein CP12-3, chloroplastic [Cinnamomum micranthum f. kanehirae]|uniref:Calvin cycle protein CP12-3, chloroplastic n=1 Tax=Cinnamomum micranthum f. kanehirae TaxID=337451 RepID=A0A3S3N4Y1_9MAGN|nr:calvin cycle protein CP12-3, chloroplastic [Cinnamomum micranthum f. kanehirae]
MATLSSPSFQSLSYDSLPFPHRTTLSSPFLKFLIVPHPISRVKSTTSHFSVQAVVKFKGIVMREKCLAEMIEKKVLEATEVCQGNYALDECKVAWDEVKEVSQAKADLQRKMEKEDPLESFCIENPEADECRIYED